MAKEHLHFQIPYQTVLHGGFEHGDVAWFPEGGQSAASLFTFYIFRLSSSVGIHTATRRLSPQSSNDKQEAAADENWHLSLLNLGLNASYNCVDRWAYKHPNKTAIIWEADEPGTHVELTYDQLLQEVCRVANVLKKMGVKKGDVSTCAWTVQHSLTSVLSRPLLSTSPWCLKQL
jgi:acetyl-CoA synthetase